MSTKRKVVRRQSSSQPQQVGWLGRLILVLSLLLMISGALLIVAWALNVLIWEGSDIQVSTAVLLILLGFAVSNLGQKNWLLAAGWLLFAVADLFLSFSLNLNLQFAALAAGLAGFALLIAEFVRRWRRTKLTQKP